MEQNRSTEVHRRGSASSQQPHEEARVNGCRGQNRRTWDKVVGGGDMNDDGGEDEC